MKTSWLGGVRAGDSIERAVANVSRASKKVAKGDGEEEKRRHPAHSPAALVGGQCPRHLFTRCTFTRARRSGYRATVLPVRADTAPLRHTAHRAATAL
jgi:hypothetical protein